jgi:hypothetical protein
MFCAAGCTFSSTNKATTGLFEDDIGKMREAFGKVRQLERGKATRKDVEALGFKFNAPNVEVLTGPAALQRIFGEAALRKRPEDRRGTAAPVSGWGQYQGYAIPYVKVEKEGDRFYISGKVTLHKGEGANIIIMFEEDILCYRQIEWQRAETKETEYAPGEGVFAIFRQFGRGITRLVETVKEERIFK